MVKLADTQDLGSCAPGREGSNPFFGTTWVPSGPDGPGDVVGSSAEDSSGHGRADQSGDRSQQPVPQPPRSCRLRPRHGQVKVVPARWGDTVMRRCCTTCRERSGRTTSHLRETDGSSMVSLCSLRCGEELRVRARTTPVGSTSASVKDRSFHPSQRSGSDSSAHTVAGGEARKRR